MAEKQLMLMREAFPPPPSEVLRILAGDHLSRLGAMQDDDDDDEDDDDVGGDGAGGTKRGLKGSLWGGSGPLQGRGRDDGRGATEGRSGGPNLITDPGADALGAQRHAHRVRGDGGPSGGGGGGHGGHHYQRHVKDRDGAARDVEGGQQTEETLGIPMVAGLRGPGGAAHQPMATGMASLGFGLSLGLPEPTFTLTEGSMPSQPAATADVGDAAGAAALGRDGLRQMGGAGGRMAAEDVHRDPVQQMAYARRQQQLLEDDDERRQGQYPRYLGDGGGDGDARPLVRQRVGAELSHWDGDRNLPQEPAGADAAAGGMRPGPGDAAALDGVVDLTGGESPAIEGGLRPRGRGVGDDGNEDVVMLLSPAGGPLPTGSGASDVIRADPAGMATEGAATAATPDPGAMQVTDDGGGRAAATAVAPGASQAIITPGPYGDLLRTARSQAELCDCMEEAGGIRGPNNERDGGEVGGRGQNKKDNVLVLLSIRSVSIYEGLFPRLEVSLLDLTPFNPHSLSALEAAPAGGHARAAQGGGPPALQAESGG